MKVAFLLCACIIPLCLLAQPGPDTLWTKRIGGVQQDAARGIEVTPDNGYIVAGWTESLGDIDGDGYLVKLDASGVQQWAHPYGGPGADFLWDVQCVPGGYVASGNSKSYVIGNRPPDAWLIRANSAGDSLWSHTYGDTLFESVYSVRRTTDGGYVMAGYSGAGSTTTDNFYVVKTDSVGARRFAFTYGPVDREDFGYRVRQTPDGGYAVCGYARTNIYDFMLLRTTSLGGQLWIHYYGTPNGMERAYDLDMTADHGFIMVGSSNGDPPENAFHPYIVRTDSAGNEVWHQMLPDTAVCYSVRALADGSFVVAGAKQVRPDGSNDVYLVRLGAQGTVIWSRTYTGADNSYAWAVRPTPDGGYVLAGHTITGSDYDMFVVKTATDPSSGVTDRIITVPAGYSLSAYPNPFNPTTTLAFLLPVASQVTLTVYDLAGREVQRVQEGFFTAGGYTASVNAGDWPSGVYFARLNAGAVQKTQKLLLIK